MIGEVDFIRCFAVKAAMRPGLVVEIEVRGESVAHLLKGAVGVEIDVFVLDAAPEPLHEYVGVSRQLHPLKTFRADVSG